MTATRRDASTHRSGPAAPTSGTPATRHSPLDTGPVWPLTFLRVVDSTNTWLASRLAAGDLREQAVCAARQTAGRGRLGRTWASPPGGLYLSLALCWPAPLDVALSPAVALAVLDALRTTCRLTLACKWPNDLWAEGRKLGGILCETRTPAPGRRFAIIGIGINGTRTPALPERQWPAISLHDLVGITRLPRRRLARAILAALARRLLPLRDARTAARPAALDDLRAAWKAHCATIGQRVRIEAAGQTTEGLAVDIAPDFALVIETPSGRRHVHAGHCRHLHGPG